MRTHADVSNNRSPRETGVEKAGSVAEQLGLSREAIEALERLAVAHLDLVHAHEQTLDRVRQGALEDDLQRLREEHEDRLFDLLAVLEGLDAEVPDVDSEFSGFRSEGFVDLPEDGPESELFLAMIDNCVAITALTESCLDQELPPDMKAFLEDAIEEEDAHRGFFERALRGSQDEQTGPVYDESGESRDLTH